MTQDKKSPGYRYGLIREEYFWDGQCRVAYGIAVYAHPHASGSAGIIASVRDMTDDRAAVERLIRQCNEGDLSLTHLSDVIDDFFDM